MNNISCEMCMDLIPLVWDGVASDDSRKAVEDHVKTCDVCREVWKSGEIPKANEEKALAKAMKSLQKISALMFGFIVLLGICLCEMVMQGSSMVFVLAALGIWKLLKIVFRKEEGSSHMIKRIAALLTAVALIVGIGWSGNELFGNPITKTKAEIHIQGYLEGAFADSDYYIEKVLYTWSGSYEGHIRSVSEPELEFYISYRDGKILYDTYENHVLDIWE